MDRLPALDLSACEREPIHTPGAIQPHGAFLAVDQDCFVITHCSANLRAILGADPSAVLGRCLDSVIGVQACRALCEPGGPPYHHAATCPGPGGSVLGLGRFKAGAHLGIDIEPVAAVPSVSMAELNRLADSLRSATCGIELCDRTVRGLRRLTGYDRVMAYRFADDGHGEVIAEACAPGLKPYLGLHYPASDIPPQARTLYITKRVGAIADTEAVPAAILVRPGTDSAPLDLTLSDLRAISPLHLQYMRNMKVAAAMRVGLIHGERLWGMLVCHHGTPYLPDAEHRAGAALMGQIAALELRNLAEAEIVRLRTARKVMLAAVVERLTAAEPLAACLAAAETDLLGLVGASGALVASSRETMLLGETPPLPAAKRVLARLIAAAKGELVAVNGIDPQHPDFAECAATASGALALPLSPVTTEAIIWFRPEQARTVHWGGNPAEHAICDPTTGELSPRRSFEAWQDHVRGRATPWTEADVLLAREFRSAFAVAAARRAQTDLVRLRDYDALTGLPKWELLHQWIGEPGRYHGDNVALLIIDVGDLSDLQGSSGCQIGKEVADALLLELARRLVEFTGSDSLAARHGETEFVMLFLGVSQQDVAMRATHIRHGVEATYLVQGQPFRLTPAFRFAFADDSGSLDLAGAADIAMAAVKAAGAVKRKVESQRQKMEGLGRMMGGIAHEINNMLQPVTLLGQDILDQDLVKPEARDTIGIILDCSRQARQIIGDLLAFARPKGRSTMRQDPVEMLHDTLRLVRQAIPPGVTLTTRITPDLPKILVNRTTFAQVLLNLATNAAAAMSGNGSLTITLADATDGAGEIGLGKDRRYISLCVIDTGCGMDKDTLDRVFEPFFTTKPVGQGTGLGLPVVFSLVEEMGGSVTLASEVGVGTTVTIDIPGAPQEEPAG